jgi:hypothetical protein
MPYRSGDTRFAIRKGSVSESGLPLLPHRSRVSRRRAARMSRLRHAASSGVFCGERGMHGIRLLQSAPGRTQDQRLGHGVESSSRAISFADCACSGRAHHSQRRLLDLAAFRSFSAAGSTKPSSARSHAPSAPATGVRHGSATSSSSANTRSLLTIAPAGSFSPVTAQEEPPGLRAAWGFSGNFRSAQFLCRVYTESSFSALYNCADLFLWSGGELDLGHCGSLHHQQRLRRSGVHLKTEGQ